MCSIFLILSMLHPLIVFFFFMVKFKALASYFLYDNASSPIFLCKLYIPRQKIYEGPKGVFDTSSIYFTR